jgi:hypothetical protein
VVFAWLEPPNAKSAGVCDGVEGFALGGATTERQAIRARNLARRCAPFHAGRVLMPAYGPKRTSLVAPHMSAFGGKADMQVKRHNFRF